uniref:Uncharacterized protein n=1 Tax=Oryctolagus cuniculus TaxID=9986 RepID=G1TFL0_RABIT
MAAVGLIVNTEHFRIIVYMPPCCHCMLLGEQLYEVKRSLSTVRYKTISKARVRRSPREAGGIPAAQRRSLSGSGGGGAAPLRGSGRAAAAAPGANGGRGCEAAAAVRQKRMKEVDNLESIKEEWVCESGSDNQCHNNNRQTNCEYFVDSLFEEAQKVGAKCLSPTEQKKQGIAFRITGSF